MSATLETIETIKIAISGVCGPQDSKIQRAQKFVLDNGENIPAILSGLNKICGGIFMSRAGLSLNIPQAQVDIIDSALIGVGKTPPSDLALKKKVGATDLTTEAEDLSRAVNELDGEIGDLSSLTTTTKSSLVGAINEHESEIGNLNLLSTAERGNLVGAINEVAASGGGGSSVYTPIGTLGRYIFPAICPAHAGQVVEGSTDLAGMVAAQQKCAVYARSCSTGTSTSTKIGIYGCN